MTVLTERIDEAVRDALRAYDDFTAGLLARRGITTPEAAEAFLSPSYDAHVVDPMTILNMPRAAARIAEAISSKERIAVWSDYDCDGIPGGVVLHDFLKKAGANFTNYIPHRHEEGFGLNEGGIDTLHADGVTLMVTVDCGIADVEQVAYAQGLGIDVIVTDHHLPGEVLPPAYAVVDPKQPGETASFRDYCGGGLAWKVACAVLAHGFEGRDQIPVGWEKWLLDMAGLATIADMVPLHGENRVLAKYGLLVMRKSPRLGLQALCKVARVNQRTLTEDDVGFMIAPRVNAASRMGNPRDAFALFTATEEAEAERLAKELERINRSRRAAAAAITRAVHERLAARKAEGEIPAVIAMGDPEWRPGLLGLVANSLAEEYERPVFLWGREGTMSAKGSCRAGRKGVNLVAIMEEAKEVFVEAGGHAASGGFTVKEDQIFFLEERLNEAFAKLVSGAYESEELLADAELTPKETNARLLLSLEKFAPFGMGNPKPVFMLRDVLVHEVSWFGKAEEHLKIKVAHDEFGFATAMVEGVSFYAKRELGKSCEKLASGGRATILANVERDQFSRRGAVRLRLVAIR